tara:strand:- start:22750 stop:23130 length:381 start_codon:yes stop_codon:yes gene_type:complete
MPNVNAIKKYTKTKVNGSDLSTEFKKLAKRNVNTVKIRRGTSPETAQQKLYFALLKTNNRLANLALNNKILQRLYNVTPLPRTSKKYSPSKRTARRQTAKAGAIVLSRKGVPRGPAQNILDILRSK